MARSFVWMRWWRYATGSALYDVLLLGTISAAARNRHRHDRRHKSTLHVGHCLRWPHVGPFVCFDGYCGKWIIVYRCVGNCSAIVAAYIYFHNRNVISTRPNVKFEEEKTMGQACYRFIVRRLCARTVSFSHFQQGFVWIISVSVFFALSCISLERQTLKFTLSFNTPFLVLFLPPPPPQTHCFPFNV